MRWRQGWKAIVGLTEAKHGGGGGQVLLQVRASRLPTTPASLEATCGHDRVAFLSKVVVCNRGHHGKVFEQLWTMCIAHGPHGPHAKGRLPLYTTGNVSGEK
jgi:hypothetical protein